MRINYTKGGIQCPYYGLIYRLEGYNTFMLKSQNRQYLLFSKALFHSKVGSKPLFILDLLKQAISINIPKYFFPGG